MTGVVVVVVVNVIDIIISLLFCCYLEPETEEVN